MGPISGSPSTYAPVVDGRDLRPTRGWYVVGGALAFVGLAGAAVLVGVGFGSLLGDTDVTPFSIGEPTVFTVDPDEPRQVYVSERINGDIAEIDCTAEAVDEGSVTLDRPSFESYVFDGDDAWVGVYDVEVTRAGDYSFDCDVLGVRRATDQVALGPRIGIAGFFGALLGGALSALVGLGLGATIVIVVAVRRSRHRRRLLAEWQYPPTRPGSWPPRY
jgi:hypothetical protein